MSAKNIKVANKGPFAGFYLFTYVGTLVYFLDKAEGFWEIVLSFLQAAVWPGLLVHKIFTILQV